MLELARESDWEAVNRLSVQVHDMHAAWRPDLYFHCEEPLTHDVFLDAICTKRLYVAKLQDVVVGYVLLAFLRREGAGIHCHKAVRIECICVEELLRGQGIGMQMVADVRALAKAFGCKEILLSVHPENDKAVSFYQKCGFHIRTIKMDMKL